MREEFDPRSLSAEEAQRLADAEKRFRNAARDPEEVEKQRKQIQGDRWNKLSDDYDPDEVGDDSYKTSTKEVVDLMEDRAELDGDDELKKILKEKSSKS